jgi:hypothetical protein
MVFFKHLSAKVLEKVVAAQDLHLPEVHVPCIKTPFWEWQRSSYFKKLQVLPTFLL